MKCPKCGYLGYQDVDRCRNCGYEFSLAAPAASQDLRLRAAEPPKPLDDLDLNASAAARPAAERFTDAKPEPPSAADSGLDELPLFGPPITDDVPLITRASPPRPPLSVRRATPEIPRLRSEPRPAIEPASRALAPSTPVTPSPAPPERVSLDPPIPGDEVSAFEPARGAARAVAALIDIALMLLVDLLIVYFALKICRLEPSELSILPKVPFVAFLLMQNAGYLVTFTAHGQTLGKMLAGVRVLAAETDSTPDVGRAAIRTLLWILLALPAGLGFLPVGLSSDARGLHDRLAGTRVVRVGA